MESWGNQHAHLSKSGSPEIQPMENLSN